MRIMRSVLVGVSTALFCWFGSTAVAADFPAMPETPSVAMPTLAAGPAPVVAVPAVPAPSVPAPALPSGAQRDAARDQVVARVSANAPKAPVVEFPRLPAPAGAVSAPGQPGVADVAGYLPTPQELLAQLKSQDEAVAQADLQVTVPQGAAMPSESGVPVGTLAAVGGSGLAVWVSAAVWRRRAESREAAQP